MRAKCGLLVVLGVAALGMVAGCNRGPDLRDKQIAELRAVVKEQQEALSKLAGLMQSHLADSQMVNSNLANYIADAELWRSNTYDRVSALEQDCGNMWLKLRMTNKSAVFPVTASVPTNSASAYKQYYAQASAAMRESPAPAMDWMAERKLKGMKIFVAGKVLQKLANGYLVQSDGTGTLRGELAYQGLCWLTDAKTTAIDGDNVKVETFPNGTHEYTTVNGSSKIVRAFTANIKAVTQLPTDEEWSALVNGPRWQ